jgi:Ca2+-binding RTX toxin-like protein
LAFESFEQRRLMAVDIVWENQGTSDDDTDGFEAAYGDDAETARQIVVAAIDSWEAVIDDFKYANVGGSDSAPEAGKFSLRVEAGHQLLPSLGNTPIEEVDSEGKPWKAIVRLDDDAAGGQWFFDSTPESHHEFSSVLSAFAAASGPEDQSDFLTVVTHEIGHALGIVNYRGPGSSSDQLRIHSMLFDIGDDPNDWGPARVRELRPFSNAGAIASMTDAGGGHLYPAHHPNDLLNPEIPTGERRLISDLDVRILRDVYGYTVKMPSDLGRHLAIQEDGYGRIAVTGLASGDGEIVITTRDDDVLVRVGPHNARFARDEISIIDLEGNGQPLIIDDSYFTPALTTNVGITRNVEWRRIDAPGHVLPSITYSNIGSLKLIGSLFDDIYNVSSTAEVVTTIQSDYGSDNVLLEPVDESSFFGPLIIYGGNNTDTLRLEDTGFTFDTDRTYTVTSTILERTDLFINYFGIEKVVVQGDDTNDVYDVLATQSGVNYEIRTGGGIDVANIGSPTSGLNSIAGLVNVYGKDTLSLTSDSPSAKITINDTASAQGHTYTILDNAVSRATYGAINYFGLDHVELRAGDYGDTFVVQGVNADTIVDLLGGNGNDVINGPQKSNLWQVKATTSLSTLNAKVRFRQIENLAGGDKQDQFVFDNGAGVSGWLNGNLGSDTLDFGAYTTAVDVDLTTKLAYLSPYVLFIYNPETGYLERLGGTAIHGIENVFAGSGNDTLTGNALNNILRGGGGTNKLTGLGGSDILVGGAGVDTLEGGYGRDLLIGGDGKDVLNGGYDDDILIGGATFYDRYDASLLAILAEWERTDLNYSARITRIRKITTPLTSTYVFNDSFQDTLTGGYGSDWFWAHLANDTKSDVVDQAVSEVAN